MPNAATIGNLFDDDKAADEARMRHVLGDQFDPTLEATVDRMIEWLVKENLMLRK